MSSVASVIVVVALSNPFLFFVRLRNTISPVCGRLVLVHESRGLRLEHVYCIAIFDSMKHDRKFQLQSNERHLIVENPRLEEMQIPWDS